MKKDKVEDIKTEDNISGEDYTNYTVTQDSTLEEKLKEEQNKYLLLYSDFENYKKRTHKEKEELKNNTKVSMITSIFDMDNDLELAIKNIKDDSAREGVELIVSKVHTFLRSQGIETIQTETYDIDLHDVVSVLDIGETKIVDVISKGYSLNGKPFRYPKIVLGR